MHFTWDVTIGQVVVDAPILWIVVTLWRIQRMLFNFRIEHETLMQDWADRQVPKRKLRELPTRQTKWW